jgi:glutathione synthase/RimK-type ligase-like ATP-grasp enzyme
MTDRCDDPGPDDDRAGRLNQACFCRTLDAAALEKAVCERLGGAPLDSDLLPPNLIARSPVFVDTAEIEPLRAVVRAIERVVRAEPYQAAVLSWAPAIARREFGPRGVLMGYDFHLTDAGPRLIEVNTNAGGAFLNALLAQAQRVCCADAGIGFEPNEAEAFEAAARRMFAAEWGLQRGAGAPVRIAIVDDAPETQPLYPEFRLAQAALRATGAEVVIADPQALVFDGTVLRHAGATVDLVYNRLVDFALDELRHAALRQAYEAGAVVLTPNPRAHALHADKRNLVLLSDAPRLRSWGIDAPTLEALAAVPRTVLVTDRNADELWRTRKAWFFKPTRGHASKGVYRGDKLTTRVWSEVVASEDYVAQAYAPPGERLVEIDGRVEARKVDVRLYAYDGEVLLAAARLYQGQATNMRTPGGGFAPLFRV